MNEDNNALPEASQILLAVLDDLAQNAKHAADPREAMGIFATAFAVYLRTPD